MKELREKLAIPRERFDEINALLLDPESNVINDFLAVVEKYGTVEAINRKAEEARKLPSLVERIKKARPALMSDIQWLIDQRDKKAFISIPEYRRGICGKKADTMTFNEDFAVTLEISALQYFPFLIEEAKQAIDKKELMPGRYIRVRNMKEQEEDHDILAIAAAMQIVGASYVETLDTRGTDGSNVHLGGPETITGYFGGVGQPNAHALQWLDEFLYYYTNYGIQQVLNINPGTVFLGYMLYKLGINNEFKISVYMGNDNPYAALWTMIGAKLFSRPDGTSPLIGFNFSNSVDNRTIEIAAQVRGKLDFEKVVRFEHHITETYKSIVRQPYDRLNELVEIAGHVANISAKHEGGVPEVDKTRKHPSDILDYFRSKKDIVDSGEMPLHLRNYLDKHDSINRTARALTESGLTFVAAGKLHQS